MVWLVCLYLLSFGDFIYIAGRGKGKVVTPQENPFENYAWSERRQEREEQGREREEESNREGRERRLQENYFKDDWYPGDWLLKKLRMPLLDVMWTF